VNHNQFRRTKKKKETRKMKKKEASPCARSKHTANDQALPCALDLAHGKVKFKFHNGWRNYQIKILDLEKL